MVRKFTASTAALAAAALLASAPAFAAPPQQSGGTGSMATQGTTQMTTQGSNAPGALAPAGKADRMGGNVFLQSAGADNSLATEWIGLPVHSTAEEEIGSIKDVVVSPRGEVIAAVVGVGGYLGVGEKDVAVNYSALKATRSADGSPILKLATTKEQIEAAPAFKKEGASGLRSNAAGMTGSGSTKTVH